MTEERAKDILEAIEAYEDKDGLLKMTPDEAAKALGNGVSAEEMIALVDYCKTITNDYNGEEIDIKDLSTVSGGNTAGWMLIALVVVTYVCIW